jgi:flavorubredoxin
MVEFLTNALIERNIKVKPFNLDVADTGELAMALIDAATVVIGSPSVLVGAHPKAVYATYLTNILRPKTKFISIVGSYGWGCKLAESITGIVTNLKTEMIDPVIIKGYPTEKDFDSLVMLAENIKEKHNEIGLFR